MRIQILSNIKRMPEDLEVKIIAIRIRNTLGNSMTIQNVFCNKLRNKNKMTLFEKID